MAQSGLEEKVSAGRRVGSDLVSAEALTTTTTTARFGPARALGASANDLRSFLHFAERVTPTVYGARGMMAHSARREVGRL